MVMIGTQRSGGGLLKKMMREPCDVGKKGVVMKDWGSGGWVEKGVFPHGDIVVWIDERPGPTEERQHDRC